MPGHAYALGNIGKQSCGGFSATLKKTVPASMNYTYIFLWAFINTPSHSAVSLAGYLCPVLASLSRLGQIQTERATSFLIALHLGRRRAYVLGTILELGACAMRGTYTNKAYLQGYFEWLHTHI